MSDKQDFLLLFDRPKEPLFTPKGENNAIFEVPLNFLESRFRPISATISNRFGGKKISVKNINVPKMDDIMQGMSRYENFSMFIPKHRRLAGRLLDIFLSTSNIEDFKAVVVYAREHVNPYLFQYAYSVALLHRPDTRDLDIPSLATTFPDKFVDGTVLQRAREELEIVPEGSRTPIVIPRDYTATDAEPEHRLAYFREDLGINLHHWHWHLVYPFSGNIEVVRKDRRGELFYYMHQQIMARYNVERLSNKLSRTERFIDLRQPIKEAYFPKLDSLVSSRGWPSRVANQSLQNLNRPVDQLVQDLDDMERWRKRIYDAIHANMYRTSSGMAPLNEADGIDVLGNMIEAVDLLSPNSTFYGQFHNMGHVFISYVHDPDARHLESFGVIGDSATAMRDPAFYRWHASIDDIFQEYKQTLPPYTAPQLNYQGVQVVDVGIDVQEGRANELSTFWMQSDVNLSRGMDFSPRGSVFARFTHLNHRPFTYRITVNNQGNPRMGTCRIFLGPKNDETGRTMLFRDQRLLMIEMDRFTVTLRPGQNTITRRSDESSVTIPFERTFRDIDTDRPAQTDTQGSLQFNFCGCGWPQHMLVPRGSPEGLPCELFVMISNYEDDRIDQTITGQCNDAYSFCGIKDRLYPDRRAMGFPFDRMTPSGVDTLTQFLTPNMRLQDVSIRFTDQVVSNPRNPNK